MDIGAYDIDLGLYFLDNPEVTDVTAKTYAKFGGRSDYAYLHMYGEDAESDMFDVEDYVTAMLEFENDCTLSLEAAWAVNDDPCHELRVLGTDAGAVLQLPVDAKSYDATLTFSEVRSGEVDHFVDSTVTAPYRDTQAEQARRILALGSEQYPVHNTVDQALAVQRILHRIYEAAGE